MAALDKPLALGRIGAIRPETEDAERIKAYAAMFRELIERVNLLSLRVATDGFGPPAPGQPAPSRPLEIPQQVIQTAQQIFVFGQADASLRVGHIAYPAGQLWKPVDQTVAGAWAEGVCVAVQNGVAAIQTDGRVKVAYGDTDSSPKGTVWPSSVAGVTTLTRPTPGTALFIQEIGFKVGRPEGGLVEIQMTLRTTPEI